MDKFGRWIFIGLMMSPLWSLCQNQETDLQLLKMHQPSVKITIQPGKGFYQKVIQPQLGSECVYEIPCRDFRKSLYREFGVVKATFLTIDRWARCSHISTMESLPVRLNLQHKIIETARDYRRRE